jgi:hypothetical protein
MARRHSKEHSRRKRISRSSGNPDERTRTSRPGKQLGNAKHLKHSQADLTRAQQAWRLTRDPRCTSIKFQEFCEARPDQNEDYIPRAWQGFLGRIVERNAQARMIALRDEYEAEQERIRATTIEDAIAQAEFVPEPAKKQRKPRAKKSAAQVDAEAI